MSQSTVLKVTFDISTSYLSVYLFTLVGAYYLRNARMKLSLAGFQVLLVNCRNSDPNQIICGLLFEPCFSTRVILHSRKHLPIFGDILYCDYGSGATGSLWVRSQGCFLTSYNAQESFLINPPTKNHPAQVLNSAKTEKSHCRAV